MKYIGIFIFIVTFLALGYIVELNYLTQAQYILGAQKKQFQKTQLEYQMMTSRYAAFPFSEVRNELSKKFSLERIKAFTLLEQGAGQLTLSPSKKDTLYE